jgi:hypothetical protein
MSSQQYLIPVGNERFRLGSGRLTCPDDLKDKPQCVFLGSHRDNWEHRFLNDSDTWFGLCALGYTPMMIPCYLEI